MKLDILTLAPAVMTLVPSHLQPLAAAVIDEIKARRAEAEQLNAHIKSLTQVVNDHTAILRGMAH